MNRVYLNRVAIWQPKSRDELSVRKSPAGRHYFENGIGKISDKPMTRYAKNYSVGRGKSAVKFCLFVMTFSDAESLVEDFLDNVAKGVSAEYARKVVSLSTAYDFEYLDEYYGGDE